MKPSTLVEHVADWHSQLEIDRAHRVVRNVAITGDTSKNGYRYTEQALHDAVSLYEQRPVFLDHAANKARPQERSTRDLVGSIVNPRYESGRIRGDIRVLDTDSGRTFLALAESNAPGVGMSHVVLAERAKPDGAVARIHDVISVDAVVFPATTSTFRESQGTLDPDGNPLRIGADDEALQAIRQSAEKTHCASSEPPHESAEGESEANSATLEHRFQLLLSERNELLATLHRERVQASAEQRERALTEIIKASGLPDYAVTETLRRQLANADDGQQRELLQERLALVEAAARRRPASRERPLFSEAAISDAHFVATLRRRTCSTMGNR
ncbi:MAG: hypothetical protein AB7U20_02650 [Planctomycetaceae bacterium]